MFDDFPSLDQPFESRPAQKGLKKKSAKEKDELKATVIEEPFDGFFTSATSRGKLMRLTSDLDADDEHITTRAKPDQSKQFLSLNPQISVSHKTDREDDSDNESLSLAEMDDQDDFEPEEMPNEEEEEALKAFMNYKQNISTKGITIADLLTDKFDELKRQEQEIREGKALRRDASIPQPSLSPKVLKIYEDVAQHMKHYRSGALPKPFKVIPMLENWEEIVALTRPDEWSPQTVFVATKLFCSNLNSSLTQRYLNLVLLPRVRHNIEQYKKLNYHLYQSLAQALYRPDAFIKGILLPLCEGGDCSLAEAVIIGSVLKKHSIPVLQACAAIEKIAEMEYSGTNSYFLRVLLDKKYNMAMHTIQTVFNHFMSFTEMTKTLPVIWFQSLLVYVQRYKDELSIEQNQTLQDLVTNYQVHHLMSAEIKRELNLAANMQRMKRQDTHSAMGIDDNALWVHHLE
ncbi:putative Essential nuclear protein 1 [Blattamonas nauphoetae]|uniref:Essential nuclear protein 1 n=1 Tax=Blattamonas nauphoetae TaxID=2049346 RepID=A0ABQ9YEP4_9EUKA|nr:putative Essential nuclear protein 1 [Blattamonas nauphoetae]